MAIKAKLLFKEHIGYRLEHELVTTRGFHVLYRLNGGGLCLQKGYSTAEEELLSQSNEDEEDENGNLSHLPWSPDPVHKEPENWWDIPKARCDELDKKCEKIVQGYDNPYRYTQEIRDQIKQMCSRMHLTDPECEWVENWVCCNVL